ncbi:hypothetical protein [Streptomyces aidingensis]|nr:hypothetical protein [Streptomyces aidingensis]
MHNTQEYALPYGFAVGTGTGIHPEPGIGHGPGIAHGAGIGTGIGTPLPDPGDAMLGYGMPGPMPFDGVPVPPPGTAGTVPVADGPRSAREHRNRHRRTRRAEPRAAKLPPVEGVGRVLAAVAATVAAAVSLLSAMAAHGPLRAIAESGDATGLVNWWPALIYGPWLVASLSIVRAALHHRRAPHAWGIVVLFSALAAVFCVAEAPRTLIGAAMAGLPVAAALSCFHQLVRQITLTRPPRRAVSGSRPPGAAPR